MEHVYVTFTDNGKVDANIKNAGLGLFNISRRARILNGRVDYDTKDGFEIRLRIPI